MDWPFCDPPLGLSELPLQSDHPVIFSTHSHSTLPYITFLYLTMGGYLHPDPAVEKWIRMRDSHAQFFRWNSRNLRSVGALGLAIPAGLMYLAVVYNVRTG